MHAGHVPGTDPGQNSRPVGLLPYPIKKQKKKKKEKEKKNDKGKEKKGDVLCCVTTCYVCYYKYFRMMELAETSDQIRCVPGCIGLAMYKWTKHDEKGNQIGWEF